MTRARAFARLAAAAALALALSGCVSLLPKSKPAQLYRFGAAAASADKPSASPGGQTVGVFWADGAFQRESANDRIFTVTGERAAYIADSRWAAPAEVLFDQAVFEAFDNAGGKVRLVPRGAPAPTDYVLRVDVRDFETRYEAGPGGAPTVLVRLHATLTRDRARTLVSDQLFEARAPAAANRVTAIVAAYDKAVNEVLGQLVAWTSEKTTG